jgi:hypothetical protein
LSCISVMVVCAVATGASVANARRAEARVIMRYV